MNNWKLAEQDVRDVAGALGKTKQERAEEIVRIMAAGEKNSYVASVMADVEYAARITDLEAGLEIALINLRSVA
jgi:hypothetical protein